MWSRSRSRLRSEPCYYGTIPKGVIVWIMKLAVCTVVLCGGILIVIVGNVL